MPETPEKKKSKKKPAVKIVRVTLVRSPIGFEKSQKRTVTALGLRRLNQTVEHVDSPSIQGMIAKIKHLVRVEEKGEL